MNNIQRADVTLLHGLWMTKLHFARHTRQNIVEIDPTSAGNAITRGKSQTASNYFACKNGSRFSV